jgi:hypothetical protein
MRIKPMAKSGWLERRRRARSQQSRGAKAKFRTRPSRKDFQSLAAILRLLNVMVKPIAPIMMTIKKVLAFRIAIPGAGVKRPTKIATRRVEIMITVYFSRMN